MDYVLAFVVLLLAAAVVALFAMLGELHARVGPAAPSTAELDEVKVGRRLDVWPKELAALASAPDAVLLVLSTSCASCNTVADQLGDRSDLLAGYETGVVLSTPDRDRADGFVREHGLPPRSVYVDVGGHWVTEAFGVQTSPSALILRDGELTSALVFGDLAALQSGVPVKQAE
jgi:hypothetical protein